MATKEKCKVWYRYELRHRKIGTEPTDWNPGLQCETHREAVEAVNTQRLAFPLYIFRIWDFKHNRWVEEKE